MKTSAKKPARCGGKSGSPARLPSTTDRNRAFDRPVSEVPAQNLCALVEHIRVQREIEERAHRFWLAQGCALKTALNDWLKAEAEVLAEFVKTGKPWLTLPSVSHASPDRGTAFQRRKI